MKRAALLTLLTLTLALPTLADEERHQSYISYDDGGTIVKSGEDGSDIEVHRNMPVYPGDEVVTARRGRAEVRLSDGNIIGIDRATALRFRSILDSYEGESNETVAELRYGKVAVQRTDIGRDHVRLDTENASYVAENESVYTVETDSRGRDRVIVFDGSLEVRTPSRTTRIRRGESATVDERGVYDLIGDQLTSSDDFERWFLRRAERFGSYNNRYMDRRLSYWTDDLDSYGSWVMVSGIGWSWRPIVSVGWRPYYNGYWQNRYGCLTWVSYDPWGWGPYHYGRWAYDPGYGWVWVPGYGYSPAWVYWTFGSGYLGWAPAGWWDCYRPYYSWAYQPYRNYRMGFGFYGRVRISDFDTRPWTFIDSNNIYSTRVDRAALTTDAIKQRLGRSRDGYATVSGGNARFTREEWNDPADAIRRRGLNGRVTGQETGAPPTDLTPFFRRDGDVGGAVRERIARGRGGTSGGYASGVPSHGIGSGGSGSIAPIGGGNVAPIGRGSVAPIGGGSSIDNRRSGGGDNRRGGDNGSSGSSGRIDRGGSTPSDPPASTPTTDPGRSNGSWRNRDRSGGDTPAVTPSEPSNGSGSNDRPRNESWRGRVRSDSPSSGSDGKSEGSSSGSSTSSGSSNDVPRRVIDRIGGARIYPRDRDSSGSSGSGSSGSSTRDRGSSSSGSRDSGSSGSSGGSRTRESAPPPPPPQHSDPPRENNSSSRGDSGGGRVKRD
jgi:hypothetical protein